ncbi:hypothetical protein J1N35_036633 [Gossypium stocksii]|uniref:SKP1 component POZ domain-containing protein n=1 Tax=Gossypium stocksii TaxID=47602 RepID=A0A9D3UJA4_9ROSI|nr:hypothetical protein J1N35_036633 [Gossypium stocksii]
MLSSKNSALESKDNEIFEVEESIATLIKTRATMVNGKAYVNEPNYLEIESLLNGVAKRVADIIKACKNVETPEVPANPLMSLPDKV